MAIWALSDLHLAHKENRAAIESLRDHGDDWLIVAGDVGETEEQLVFAWRVLTKRFARVVWVPGNHELWTVHGKTTLRGVALYERLVQICRDHGVLTPEDPWELYEPGIRVAPMHLLYDYSFGPDGMTPAEAVAWARETRIRCRDEDLLHPDPYPTREAWCQARCDLTEERLRAVPDGERIVAVNHFPLRRDLVRLFRIPRFTIWCGTRRTEDWHQRYPFEVVVSGHLHMRATDWRDGVRFEEVSLGYPRHWRRERTAEGYLRRIWPGPPAPGDRAGTIWHR